MSIYSDEALLKLDRRWSAKTNRRGRHLRAPQNLNLILSPTQPTSDKLSFLPVLAH